MGIDVSKMTVDADSVAGYGNDYDGIVRGIDGWSGASYDHLVSHTENITSGFNQVQNQMAKYAQARAKFAEYQKVKTTINQKKVELTSAKYKLNSKDISDEEKASLNDEIERLNNEIQELEEKKDGLKGEIEGLLGEIGGVEVSADSGVGTYDVNVDTGFDDGGYTGGGSSVGGYSGSVSNSGSSSVSRTLTPNTGSSKKSDSTSTKSDSSSKEKSSTKTTSGKNVKVGDLDMDNYPKGDSLEDGKERAVLVAKYLMKNGGFTAEQAAAMAGVYLDENNCDPGEVMEAEKNGQGAPGTGGNGYGAGIASWTFEDSKRQSLSDAGFDPDTPIENLSMAEQCDVIIAESQKSSKQYYDALKRCDTLEDASATAVVITGGVGFSNNWDTHPTPAEAKALADYYGSANDASFGASDYHWNLDQRRLEYAKEIYDRL